MIGNAFIIMGEIGGNDFNFAFFVNKTSEVKELVPLVITKISSAIVVNILDQRVPRTSNFFKKLLCFLFCFCVLVLNVESRSWSIWEEEHS